MNDLEKSRLLHRMATEQLGSPIFSPDKWENNMNKQYTRLGIIHPTKKDRSWLFPVICLVVFLVLAVV